MAAAADADLPGLRGQASFYGQGFKGRRTASGERFDPRRFTAASNRFPLGTRLAVLRPDTGRCAVVRVNDRMAARHRRRIIDVSRAVAEQLQMLRAGIVVVRVVVLTDAAGESAKTDCRTAFAGDGIDPDEIDPAEIDRDFDPADAPPADRPVPG
jgi:rare lipoprotein A